MPTIEERLQTLEQEHTELKRSNAELQKAVELMNIALGALVNKATLEKINEQNNKLFDNLMRHDQFTNQQLAELRGQFTELDGKVVGLQKEMRQRFTEQDNKIAGLQTEMRQRFAEHTALLQQILARLPE